MSVNLCASDTSISANTASILYQNDSAQLEIAQHPLSIRAVDISLQDKKNCHQLDENNFSDVWKTRYIAETHLAQAGYNNRLCYSKLEAGQSPVWQVTAYSNLPGYLDNWLTRKIYSISQQTKALFRTFFPIAQQSETALQKERSFWSSLDSEIEYSDRQKNGWGDLTDTEVINRQIVFPNTWSSEEGESEILLLYNYAPLRTGNEQMHFLLIPNPAKPAKNFLELNEQQYTNVLSLTNRTLLWAEEMFEGKAVVHYLEKTDEIAGQKQPLFHAHLIIVKEQREEIWGRIAMFLRMFFPPSPLNPDKLKERVTHYRNTLGNFLAR